MNKRDRKRLWGKLKATAAMICGIMTAALLWPQDGETRNGWDRISESTAKVMIALAGFLATSIGGWEPITRALAFAMGLDYISGFLVGLFGKSKKTANGKLSSKVGFLGLFKKALMLAVVALAHQLDVGVNMGTSTFRDLVCWCYIANDGISFYENLQLLGVPMPGPLKKVLDKMRDTGEGPKTTFTTTDEQKKGTGLG